MATPTVEAYLEMIYLMAVEGQAVIGARLAESLHVSRPTVTATLQRMVKDGHIKVNAKKEIQLTTKGRSIAEFLQRRHCVIERWLVDVLELEWGKSDAAAHRLEHAMPDEVAELLNKHLGQPATCPHGNPIPGNVANVAASNRHFIRLSTVKEGERVVVGRISEYDEDTAELLKYLDGHGIRPDAELRVGEFAPMSGPLTVTVSGKIVSISREIANYIWVRR